MKLTPTQVYNKLVHLHPSWFYYASMNVSADPYIRYNVIELELTTDSFMESVLTKDSK